MLKFLIPSGAAVLRAGALGLALCATSAGFAADAALQAKSSFTPTQRDELKKLIHAYIVENPDVITEAVSALQAKEDAARDDKQKTVLKSRKQDLMEPGEGTVLGNLKGDVTIVEFFDYNCGYCKNLFPAMMETVKEDGKVRLVMKEFPILGPSSVTAAKAALASVKQGKYPAFHMALLGHKGALSDEVIMSVAKDTGLDVAQMQKDMKAADVDKTIEANHTLARDLQITGTPALVIGNSFVPGAVSKDSLKELIAKARAKS